MGAWVLLGNARLDSRVLDLATSGLVDIVASFDLGALSPFRFPVLLLALLLLQVDATLKRRLVTSTARRVGDGLHVGCRRWRMKEKAE